MNNKKKVKIKKELEKKKEAKKQRRILIIGIILFTVAMVQVSLLTYYFVNSTGHNQIIFNNEVVTSEVCTLWFNSSYSESAITDTTPFVYKSQLIPMNVMSEVCDKWKKIKEEIDKNNNIYKE